MKKTVFIMLLVFMLCCTTCAFAQSIFLEGFGFASILWIIMSLLGKLANK